MARVVLPAADGVCRMAQVGAAWGFAGVTRTVRWCFPGYDMN